MFDSAPRVVKTRQPKSITVATAALSQASPPAPPRPRADPPAPRVGLVAPRHLPDVHQHRQQRLQGPLPLQVVLPPSCSPMLSLRPPRRRSSLVHSNLRWDYPTAQPHSLSCTPSCSHLMAVYDDRPLFSHTDPPPPWAPSRSISQAAQTRGLLAGVRQAGHRQSLAPTLPPPHPVSKEQCSTGGPGSQVLA